MELSEQDGVLSLHLGSELIQSAMRLDDPLALEIAYTRYMMAFLLFQPEPRDILMIGLGGGSLARFIHHHLPAAHTVAVEINDQVVSAARNFFRLPRIGPRFRVVVADGADYVAQHGASCDVLMVDGFDDSALPANLASQEFFSTVAEALRPDGVLVMNLLGRDRRLNTYLKRIQASLPCGLWRLKAEPDGNVVVIASLRNLDKRWWRGLARRAAALEKRIGLPFREYARDLQAD